VSHLPAALAATILTATLAAQVAPGNAVVAVRLTGNPATRLLAADLASGAFTTLPGFPADAMPPLAIEFDRIDNELLLALDAGNGISRVFRYTMQNGIPVQERVLGDVPGHVTELTLGGEQVLAAVDGAQGGIYRLPRTGGTAALSRALPDLTVLQTGAPNATLALVVWSAGQPGNPGAGILDLTSGGFFFGATSFVNYAHPDITGAMELPFPQPRVVLSHADGAVTVHQMTYGGGAQPTALPIQPTPPPGSAAAMKPGGAPWRPVVLGSSAFPMLWTFDPMAALPTLSMLAGPLPGDPVDFAIAPSADAQLRTFGTACGPNAMAMQATGGPILGTTFQIALSGGAPNALALFVLGLSDQLGGLLPFQLPSGCLLRVSPDSVLLHTTDAAGRATRSLAVPGQPWLVGLVAFAQWLQAPALPFATSDALAIRFGI
jgi:hypothetical protein